MPRKKRGASPPSLARQGQPVAKAPASTGPPRLSSNWSTAISRMWREPIRHDDDQDDGPDDPPGEV
jgi:hypothetical protein